ncbi:MAG: phosphoadenylyl-sulfate reductase [Planctomycetaceae bacterium]
MPRLSQAKLLDLNKSFDDRSPEELLHWCRETFGPRVAAISAMQKAGSVICHMVHRLKLDIPIVFVDTGVMFQETLDTRDRIQREYNLKMRTLSSEMSMAEQSAKFGVLYLSVEGQKQCCHMRKVEPLRAIAGEFDGLIGSLRRAEGGKRGGCPIVAVDPEMNAIRVNPLANMSDEQLEAYVTEHNVIINPLHEQGFTTIGCNRCTTPVLPSEPPRAGRWRHLGPWSMYCGINPTDLDDSTAPSVDLPQDLIDRVLGQKTDFMI